MLQLTTILFFIAFSLLAVIHIISLKLFLYWRFLWLDIPMHALGGAVIALGLFTLHDLGLLIPRRFLRIVPVLLIVFAISSVWEIYELIIGVPIEEGFLVDTASDYLMGLIGGYIGLVVGNSIRKLQ